MISIIAAAAYGRVIGYKGAMPWHISDDLRNFKRITSGKTVLMGRNTFESLKGPLPNRKNLVLTKDTTYNAAGITVFNTLQSALSSLNPDEELMVIGGEALYKQALPLATKQYLTLVHGTFLGDTFYPRFDPSLWNLVSYKCHPINLPGSPYKWSYMELQRI